MKKIIVLLGSIVIGTALFAQAPEMEKFVPTENTMTIDELCSLEIKEETTVKLKDELNRSKNHDLFIYCSNLNNKMNGKLHLDLSECTFPDDTRNILFTNLPNVKSIVLPSETLCVTLCAGSDIENVILPKGLKRIEMQAFYMTSLKEIVIPESVEYVGACAFQSNENLQYIFVGNNSSIKDWSNLWNVSCSGKVFKNREEADSLNDSSVEETNGVINFSKKVGQLYSEEMDIEIILKNSPDKTEEGILHFYDDHNDNAPAGSVKICLKKGKKSYKIKKFNTENLEFCYEGPSHRIMSECGEYWMKVKGEIELKDGTKLSLDGYCLLYVLGYENFDLS